MEHLVFVYGTLKRGQWNHHLLRGQTHVGNGETKEKFALYALAFPWLTKNGRPGDAPSTVSGEVYSVDERTLQRLDSLEGYPYHYDRMRVEVHLSLGTVVRAWAYYVESAESIPRSAVFLPDGYYRDSPHLSIYSDAV